AVRLHDERAVAAALHPEERRAEGRRCEWGARRADRLERTACRVREHEPRRAWRVIETELASVQPPRCGHTWRMHRDLRLGERVRPLHEQRREIDLRSKADAGAGCQRARTPRSTAIAGVVSTQCGARALGDPVNAHPWWIADDDVETTRAGDVGEMRREREW